MHKTRAFSFLLLRILSENLCARTPVEETVAPQLKLMNSCSTPKRIGDARPAQGSRV